ncbi:hypothetical protein HS7_00150 [Sulfolobales archaeon HS-7]|nr:hypothetical protein HS7_00150 [Sulfolobales archaeon HS-7]
MKKIDKNSLTFVGISNFLLRFSTSPLSFLFSVFVAKVLSAPIEGKLIFGSWQLIYVTATGYFAVYGDTLSVITSRYAAEGRKVGGIFLINLGIGAAASLIYSAIVPFLMHASGYYEPIYFYSGVIMIFSYYAWRSVNAISTGRTPFEVGVGNAIFQVARIVAGVVLLLFLHQLILGVVLAYAIGYASQSVYNLFYVKSSLILDLKIAWEAMRKSVIFIGDYSQIMIENGVSLFATFLLTSIPNSYFESALIIANIASYAITSYTGLVNKLVTEGNPSQIVFQSLRLYALTGGLALAIIGGGGYEILRYLRPDYVEAVYGMLILAAAYYLKGIFRLFYFSITVLDEKLGVGSREELRGLTALTVKNNLMLTLLGTGISFGVMYVMFRLYPITMPNFYALFTVTMSIGILLNAIGTSLNSRNILRKRISFNFPKREFAFSLLSAVLASVITFSLIKEPKLLYVALSVITSAVIYLVFVYLTIPYVRHIVSRTLRLLT